MIYFRRPGTVWLENRQWGYPPEFCQERFFERSRTLTSLDFEWWHLCASGLFHLSIETVSTPSMFPMMSCWPFIPQGFCQSLAHHPTGQLAIMYSIHIARYGLSDLYTFKQSTMDARYSIIAVFSLQIYELFAVYAFLLFYFSLRRNS